MKFKQLQAIALLLSIVAGVNVTAQNLPLGAGSSYPLTGSLYHQGSGEIRRAFTSTNFGYYSGYRVLMLGSASTSHNTAVEGVVTLSFNYDPSTNTDGSFQGDGRELLFRNGASFVTPNTANTGFYFNNLVMKNGNVGIGSENPAYKLVVSNAGANGLEINPVDGLNNGTDIVSYNRSIGAYTPIQIAGSSLLFGTSAVTNGLALLNNGNVGINTGTPSEKLSVNGNIKADGNITARKITATASGWPDYVFHPSYKLKPLSDVAQFIRQNQHLPDVPSANEVEQNGINLGDNQAVLLKKIEELTLYLIEIKNENNAMKDRIQGLENKINK